MFKYLLRVFLSSYFLLRNVKFYRYLLQKYYVPGCQYSGFLRIFGLRSAYGIYRVQMAYSRVYRVFMFVDSTILGTTRYICHVYIDVL